ncbi:MAG: chorismate synthase [Acidobacteria bacterium]|nr:chorismate synthase [Acidobacteriota bacterium]
MRFLTAGESHGQGLVTILEGLPAGLTIDIDAMTVDLRRRQGGYGRGRRMAIESDRAEILSGVRRGRTTGAPVALLVRNKDWENWQNTMHVEPQAPAGATGANRAAVVRPRPGHADLAGALKYDHDDIRDVLERASARETAARVAAGAIARQLLAAIGCELTSHITGIGPVVIPAGTQVSFEAAQSLPLEAPLRCTDPMLEQQMMASIDAAKEAGDTLGGSFEVIVRNVPVGLGSYVHWDRKLDGRLAQALMSIPAIKAVAVGDGVDGARRPGSLVHDEIVADAAAAAAGEPVLRRPTNRAGGLEGGVTNGEEVRMTGFMKPIATLMKPLRSIDLTSMEDAPAAIERSDVCAVPAAAVVAEAMVALVLADAVLERFGGDSMTDLLARVTGTGNKIRARLSIRPTSARA